jgi:transposase-like protein
MAHLQVTIDTDKLKDLFASDAGMAALAEEILNQVLDAQMTEHLQAKPYERTDRRRAYRNGYKPRQLTTRVGTLTLRVPQARDGSFSTDLFRRYQHAQKFLRGEQALVLAMMEMVNVDLMRSTQGVSTRKVTKITEELCGAAFSKSTVSRLCEELDVRVEAWNERPLKERSYPFVIVDAMQIKVRRDEAVRSTSALIAIGINEEGYREVLGLDIGDSESEGTWERLFKRLKARGLRGVELITSDSHGGLVKAARRQFQGAAWQRCQTHLMRNVLGQTPRHLKAEMAAWLRRIFRSESKAEARQAFGELAGELDGKAESALQTLEAGLEDAIAVLALPAKYRRRLRTTNMVERLIEEIRRRERVIRIFPNSASAHRLVGALLQEQHEEWLTGRKYFDMSEYFEWKQARRASSGEAASSKAASIQHAA